MANPHKGEFDLALSGTRYRFRMGTEALVELQESLSLPGDILPLDAILRDVQRGRLKYVRAFLWAGLRRYHPEVTLADLNELLDDADEQEVTQLLVKLGLSTVPDKQDLEALTDGRRPQKAQPTKRRRGTGANSISTPAVSA